MRRGRRCEVGRRRRRAFNLVEVMISLALLVTSMLILMETQNASVHMTREAERVVTATGLAQEKMNEVALLIEEEGFGDTEMEEEGDFSQFGDEELDLQFGESLEDYQYRWTVWEIDLGLAGDIAGMAEGMAGSGYWGDSDSEVARQASTSENKPDLSSFGVSNDMITEMLARYIREVRVEVWWGGSFEQAEERGDLVVLTTHVINPSGQIVPGASSGDASGGASSSTSSAPVPSTRSSSGGRR